MADDYWGFYRIYALKYLGVSMFKNAATDDFNAMPSFSCYGGFFVEAKNAPALVGGCDWNSIYIIFTMYYPRQILIVCRNDQLNIMTRNQGTKWNTCYYNRT